VRRFEPTRVALVLGLVAVGAYVAALGWLMQHRTYDTWGALVIAPILILVTLPVLARAARATGQPWLYGWTVTALVAKLLASYARYYVAFVVYGGDADAAGYNKIGGQLSQLYRHGNFHETIRTGGAGTKVLESVTGIVYTVTGPTLLGGYLVFAWIGFWGLLMAYLAFHTAIPEGFQKRYAAMVFFLPSLLFWPSGIGKEAWMTMGIGFAMWGAARLMVHRRGGLLLLAVGWVVTALVRPHVTVILTVALVVAYLMRRSRRVTSMTPVVKIGGFIVLAVATYLTVRVAANFLGVQDFSASGFEGALSTAQDRTAKGGSQFTGAALNSPLGLPWAILTVLYRPFPWEVDSLQALMAAAEGVFLMFLTWRYRHSLVNAFRMVRSAPYVTFCLTYTFGYILVFSGFSNFGILVRERSLALPVFVVLLALPVAARHTGDRQRQRPRQRPRSRAVAVP